MKCYSKINTLYVSTEFGNDQFSGCYKNVVNNYDGPCKTIDYALKKIGQMRRAGYVQPISLKLLDDEYFLDDTLTIGLTKTYPFQNCIPNEVTLEPYGNKKVSFYGGKKIDNFKPDVFNGKKCLSAEIDGVKEGKVYFDDFFVNGKYLPQTRLPKTGYLIPESVEVDVSPEGYSLHPSHYFYAKPGDINVSEESLKKAKIVYYHLWMQGRIGIKSYDRESRKCVLNGVTRVGVSIDQKTSACMNYYLENVKEGFLDAGDWYLDVESGKVYYIPKDGENAENITAFYPTVQKLVSLSGEEDNKLHGFRFRNIAFKYGKSDLSIKIPYTYLPNVKQEYADEDGTIEVASTAQCVVELTGAIFVKNCSNIEFDGCDFSCLGAHGIRIDTGCDHVTIKNSHIHKIGAGGVAICGGGVENPNAQTHDVKVYNCHIEDLGNRHNSGCGILITHAYACDLSHNTIHNLYYSGICAGWVWGYAPSITNKLKISHNHIYDLGKGVLSDMGGVYTLAKQTGTVVSNNLIHDIVCRDYGGWALYGDEGTEGVLYENNVCYNVNDTVAHQHYGKDNVYRNNILAFGKNGVIKQTVKEAQVSMNFECNILCTYEDKPIYYDCSPYGIGSDNNLIYCFDGELKYADMCNGTPVVDIKKGVVDYEWDKNSVVKNPRFIDVKKFNFALRKDSPAYKMGFKDIDLSEVGCKIK